MGGPTPALSRSEVLEDGQSSAHFSVHVRNMGSPSEVTGEDKTQNETCRHFSDDRLAQVESKRLMVPFVGKVYYRTLRCRKD